ncbi:helix-turn-helix transcriptional regulator [Lampropedia puyangensis]|uniref:Helix-turn-helix transcriptional regulator n=2 Tax=Lampropedia puyangensis TaxID=1330072 RepID=A0A4S8EZF7_9BURK|nr:helix-turn-helix transcriptional regulator [Lampropedia puyangensis]
MGGRSGRSPSVFGRGGLQLVLLQLISEQASHGYELIKAIEERLQGRYSPSPGVVYPRLAMLEDMGYILAQKPDTQGRRRYSITPAGRDFLQKQKSQVDVLMARMEGGVDGAGLRGGRPAPVARAIENLKMAMRLRLTQPLSQEQALAFAAILDEAASRIERLPSEPTNA